RESAPPAGPEVADVVKPAEPAEPVAPPAAEPPAPPVGEPLMPPAAEPAGTVASDFDVEAAPDIETAPWTPTTPEVSTEWEEIDGERVYVLDDVGPIPFENFVAADGSDASTDERTEVPIDEP